MLEVSQTVPRTNNLTSVQETLNVLSVFYTPFPTLSMLKALGVRCPTSGGVGRTEIAGTAVTALCS